MADTRNNMVSLSDKEYKAMLEAMKAYSDPKNWNFEDCVCLRREGGFWIGPGVGPSLAIEILNKKQLHK